MNLGREYHEAFYTSAAAVGLLPDEADLLWRICSELDQYSSYETLRTNSADLAANYNHVEFEPGRGLASDGRSKIGVTTIWGSGSQGGTAYLQGREHASEPVGAETVAVLNRLLARHPGILHRLGYVMLQSCDHIDPVGQSLQEWGIQPPTNVVTFANGAWRGSWRDQISWGYPTDSYHDISPENELSLQLLHENLDFFGSLHGSTFGSYVLVSRKEERLATELYRILQGSGLELNRDQPEAPDTPTYNTPGVFATVNKTHLDKSLVSPKAPQEEQVGTNALDHIGPRTLMLIPEIACFKSTDSDAPSGFTRYQAAVRRDDITGTASILIDRTIYRLDAWLDSNLDQLEVRRLYDAITWYSETVPQFADSAVRAAAKDAKGGQPLSRAEYVQSYGVFAAEALLFAGNARRLARQAGRTVLQNVLEEFIRQGAATLGPTRPIPLGQQVATQSLLVLAGMRRAIQK